MRLLTGSLIVIFLFNAFLYGQNSARRQKLVEIKRITSQLKPLIEENKQILKREIAILFKLKSASGQDLAEAKRLNAQAVRLFPCCDLEKKVREMDELTYSGFSDLWETELSGSNNWFSFSSISISDFIERTKPMNSREIGGDLEYNENSLNLIRKNNGNHGFIFDAGNKSFESISGETEEIRALAEYRPPTEAKDIRKGFVSNGFAFGQSVPVTVGNTYILRVVKYGELDTSLDGIFAVKVHRAEAADGSIILFIKTIKQFETPQLKEPEREEFFRVFNLGLAAKLKEELSAKGFNDIQIEVNDKLITLKGTVPQGKSAEAAEIAAGIYFGMKVKNELTEK